MKNIIVLFALIHLLGCSGAGSPPPNLSEVLKIDVMSSKDVSGTITIETKFKNLTNRHIKNAFILGIAYDRNGNEIGAYKKPAIRYDEGGLKPNETGFATFYIQGDNSKYHTIKFRLQKIDYY